MRGTVPDTRHMFSESHLFPLIGGVSCDPEVLDLISAFKGALGSPVGVRKVSDDNGV